MNIKDVDDVNLDHVKDSFEYLWNEQYELYEKYKDIEGMPDKWPFNINLEESQIWIKDFFWRVWEELMEAYEALTEEDDIIHYLEELIDALHFYLEIYVLLDRHINIEGIILSVKNCSNISEDISALRNTNHKIGYWMGLAANKLRNKKWKKSQVLVDVDDFNNYLDKGFRALVRLICRSLIPSDNLKYDLLNSYHKKNIVNRFRQRSNY